MPKQSQPEASQEEPERPVVIETGKVSFSLPVYLLRSGSSAYGAGGRIER